MHLFVRSLVSGLAVAGCVVAVSACELVSTVDRSQIEGQDPDGGDPTTEEARCGDGRVTGSEACDDGAGNGTTPCGCSATCTYAAEGTSCGNPTSCTAAACDGRGACAESSAPRSCDDGQPGTTDFCVTGPGCGHLAFAAPKPTTLRGNANGGTENLDACAPGSVLVGLNAKVGDSIDQAQVVCAKVQIDTAAKVTLGAPETPHPFRGTNENGAASTICPAHHFVVGFSGRAASLVDQVALRCAPVVVDASKIPVTVTAGTVTPSAPLGGTGGGVFEDTNCETGSVATGAVIRAGGSVDAFGLLCSAPSVTP